MATELNATRKPARAGFPLTPLECLCLAVFAVAPILPCYVHPYLIHDLAQTVYHVRELAVGRMPYREIYNHHFLGYLIPFVLVDNTFGLTRFSLVMLQSASQLLAALATSFFARELSDAPKAPFYAALSTVTIGWLPNWFGPHFNYQSNTLPYLAIYLALAARARSTGSRGALAAAAVSYGLLLTMDQRFVVFALPLVLLLATMAEYRTARAVATAAVGVTVVPIFCLFWLWRIGALPEFYEQTVRFPLVYRNATVSSPLVERAARLLRDAIRTEPSLLLSLIGILCFVRCENRGRGMFLLTGLTAAVIYACAAGRGFRNYLLVLEPFVAVGVAVLPAYWPKVLRASGPKSAERQRQLLSLLVFALAGSSIYTTMKVTAAGSVMNRSLDTFAAEIVKNGSPSDDLFVWGYCPQLFVEADKLSRFRDMGLISVAGSLFHLAPPGPQTIVPEMFRAFESFVKNAPPALVVLPELRPSATADPPDRESICIYSTPASERQHPLNWLRAFVKDHYTLVTQVPDGDFLLSLYRRR